jgi:hypothetical protein
MPVFGPDPGNYSDPGKMSKFATVELNDRNGVLWDKSIAYEPKDAVRFYKRPSCRYHIARRLAREAVKLLGLKGSLSSAWVDETEMKWGFCLRNQPEYIFWLTVRL